MNDSHRGRRSQVTAEETRMNSGGFCHGGGKEETGKLTLSPLLLCQQTGCRAPGTSEVSPGNMRVEMGCGKQH